MQFIIIGEKSCLDNDINGLFCYKLNIPCYVYPRTACFNGGMSIFLIDYDILYINLYIRLECEAFCLVYVDSYSNLGEIVLSYLKGCDTYL